MRHSLCNEECLIYMNQFNIKILDKTLNTITELEKDLADNVQRYTIPTEEVIYRTKGIVSQILEELMRGKYSAGASCKEIEDIFYESVQYLKDDTSIGYFNIIEYISIAILLDAPTEIMQVFVDKTDEAEENDILLDYLITAYGLKRKRVSTEYYKEKPYREMMEIVSVAKSDKKKASDMLFDYTEKHWLKAHSDIDWPRLSKDDDYCGFWSFEAGAVAKILNLDDSKLVNSDFYPYDLVHYKTGVEYREDAIDQLGDITGEGYKSTEGFKAGIPYNTSLEQIIPIQFHEKVNQIIVDYETMEDLDFWNKYELDQIWYNINDYIKNKKKGNLGELIVFILIDEDYILQLDWKEDLEDHEEHIRNYWKDEDTKMIEFHLDDDQQYFAKIPRKNQICDVYEIKVSEVRSVASDE